MHSSSALVPDVSVILPCAGFGTRFSAPYPKELHGLAPGVTVLDRSLESAVEMAKSGLGVRVVVVFRGHKLDTVRYLERYADLFQLVFVYQDESFGNGLDGAIETALPMTRGPVALVLPDIVVIGAEAVGCLGAAVRKAEETGWSVVARREQDPEALLQGAALTIAEQGDGVRVIAAAEKPDDAEGFNARWGMVAVAEEHAARLPDVVRKGIANPLCGADVVLVDDIVNYNSIAE